eukprot:gb/GEZJ01001539.1/.p1 GENE.gb/GEZJ01001539.1/~~gb/GEZJ01001539.1/.p1  ORF type:complete len:436 (-),score=60.49 gb/GEZJ01001539.1/:588-1895(-)
MRRQLSSRRRRRRAAAKLLLTRRAHQHMLRATSRPPPSSYSASSSSSSSTFSPSAATPSLRAPPPPPEQLLAPLPPVRTYVFQRALITAARGHRRPADPPYRYLRVRYGLLTPFAPGYLTASNPRAAGAPALKRWYLNARRWRLLHQPLASPSSRLLLSRRKPPHPSPSSPSSVLPSQPSQPSQPPLVLPHVHATRSAVDTTLALAPRLIVVGDVHGCIDELQALLRLADYAPGDQVIFLGDLVAKGPDSAAVVQLAREIGARTVRGNHDYELIRFCAARRRGLDPVVSPEHARIAATLSHQDYNFLCDAPWFIECAPWKHLFVHAGFIPRVKLTQQNPRLMMNMRSVLPDGTVTAKSVAGCEWARLWTGPQTVVFGHDACRGLQQYPFAKGIDTGCVYGGRLTALLLPENRLLSVAAKRPYVSPRKLRSIRTTP